MTLALLAIAAILLVVAVTTLAPKVGIAPPLLLVVLGLAATFLPFVESVSVPSEFVLAGVLPPLLYSSAVNTRVMEFRRDFRLISAFSVVLVVASALGVGVVICALVPGLPLGLGVALGAIVSPTDAVATSIVRKAGVSPRIVTVLEGESMLNDASALVLLRTAVAAVGVTVSIWGVLLDFVWAVVVAVVIGYVIGRANLWIQSRIPSVPANVALSLAVPYLAFLPAEHAGASGLVAAVAAGLITGMGAPRYLGPEDRLTQTAVWGTIELLLESGIFLLVGLEIPALVNDLTSQGGNVTQAVVLAIVAATVVIAIRAVFVAWSLYSLARRNRRLPEVRERLSEMKDRIDGGELPDDPRRARGPGRVLVRPETAKSPDAAAPALERWRSMVARRLADMDYLAAERLGWREGVVLVAAGMRGAVTIAAAQSLAFGTPYRSLLVLVATLVAVGTLLIQGASLGWIAARLGLSGGATDSDPDVWAALQADLAKAGLRHLQNEDVAARYPSVVEPTRAWLERLHAATEDTSAFRLTPDHLSLRIELIEAERTWLVHLQGEGTYPSDLLNTALTQLDAEQLSMELRKG